MEKNNIQPSKETLNAWHKDPASWKWGMFYYKKNDKRIFPPKRVAAFGWTANFANPYSILIMIGIIILLFASFKLVQDI
jgi:uncharacterized membrane protein